MQENFHNFYWVNFLQRHVLMPFMLPVRNPAS